MRKLIELLTLETLEARIAPDLASLVPILVGPYYQPPATDDGATPGASAAGGGESFPSIKK